MCVRERERESVAYYIIQIHAPFTFLVTGGGQYMELLQNIGIELWTIYFIKITLTLLACHVIFLSISLSLLKFSCWLVT
jgi:hypothetical protein